MIVPIRQRRMAPAFLSVPVLLFSIGLLIPGCGKSKELAADLEKAVRRGDVAQVEQMLNDAPELLTERYASQTTLLHIAAAAGQVPVIEILLAKNSDIEALDARSRTPLLYAATHENPGATACLLEHGANLAHKDAEGHTALHRAVESNRATTVALLIKRGADVNTRLRRGTTPLHSALLLRFRDVAALLLEAGADPSAKMGDGTTPLSLARSRARQDLIDLLLKHGAK